MKKKLIFLFLSIFVVLVGIGSISALLCKGSDGYYTDCGYGSYGPRYYVNYDYSEQKISNSYKRTYTRGYSNGFSEGYVWGYDSGYYQGSKGYSYNSYYKPNLYVDVKYRPRKIIIKSYYR